ncbi:hypothetical protein JNUCC42_05945 [Brevibacterium sp. JNUCC-42]|nr:hypothetical protein JNUCC42_05945 [Brevibacterium sp. JNUCC-42]
MRRLILIISVFALFFQASIADASFQAEKVKDSGQSNKIQQMNMEKESDNYRKILQEWDHLKEKKIKGETKSIEKETQARMSPAAFSFKQEIGQKNMLYKLKPKYLVTNFTFNMMAATVTENENNVNITGIFRTNNDLMGSVVSDQEIFIGESHEHGQNVQSIIPA